MSYTVEIKEEISTLKNTKSEIIAELSGFIRNNGEYQHDLFYLTTENPLTVERLTSFF